VRDSGDWEGWLVFLLKGVIEVAGEATATARRIVGLRESHRHLITDGFGRVAASGLKVLESLYSKPITSVKEILALTGISFPSASDLVKRFIDIGLLVEVTGQARNRRFSYVPFSAIFSEENHLVEERMA
jgi:Fic family protein